MRKVVRSILVNTNVEDPPKLIQPCVAAFFAQAPEPKLRSGSADNVDEDNCAYNWIHHNTMRSYGNECVDVKEGSADNLIEYNQCEDQQDPNSGCFGLRGSDNTVRWNKIADCEGAGVRMGGDNGFGRYNNVYGNTISNAKV